LEPKSQLPLTIKKSSLQSLLGTKVSTSTYNQKMAALDALMGSKVSTTTYNAKMNQLDTSIDAIEDKIYHRPCLSASDDDFHPARIFYGTCIRISKEEKNFDNASKICSSLGSKLFEPKTWSINNDIATEARNVIYWYWIGINDKGTEGKLVYNSDGQEISWSNWRPGQPDGGSSANCVHTHVTYGTDSYGRSHHGKWYDTSCNDNRNFICEF